VSLSIHGQSFGIGSITFRLRYNKHIDGTLEMSNAPIRGGKLCNVITHNVVWANQKTESFMYHWLCTLAMFDVNVLSAFVRASDVILRIQSIR